MTRQYLVDLRKECNWTSTQASQALGLSPSYYSQIENGRRAPDLNVSVLNKIAQAYRKSPEAILYLETEYQAAKSKTA